MRSGRERIVQLLEQCFISDWKEHETKESELTVKLSTSKRGNPCIYGEVECPFGASLVVNYLQDPQKRSRYEEFFIEEKELEKLALDTKIVYLRYKKYIVSSERDFLFRQQVLKLEKGLDLARWGWEATPEQTELFNKPGIYVQAGSSILYPSFAASKPIIRGELLVKGHIVVPTGASSCRLISISEVDPKGSIPKWVVQRGAAS